jgi:hypothetical protein
MSVELVGPGLRLLLEVARLGVPLTSPLIVPAKSGRRFHCDYLRRDVALIVCLAYQLQPRTPEEGE